jgi:nicotinate-nucleotide adenylyltransferase
LSARIGILGGTFDPIHYGHLLIAEEVRAALGLQRTLLIPAGRQPLKHGAHVASPAQRLAMTRLACVDNPALEVSPVEVERPGLSYTVTTLEELHRADIGQLHFILGADALVDLHRWYDAPRILQLARIVAVRRPGHAPDIDAIVTRLPGLREQLIIIDGPLLEISSSELRQRVAAGKPIRYMTPDPVVEYIAANGLYQPEPNQGGVES